MTPERPKSPPKQDKPTAEESLIKWNGELVEEFYKSTVYCEIIQPVLSEAIASVTGRLTNGRYYHGSLTRNNETMTLSEQRGYVKALMDFHNYLHDFVLAKGNLLKAKKTEDDDKKGELYNPFMEEFNEETRAE